VKAIVSRWLDNSFARSVGLLAGGTALGQAVLLLALPLLTRLYTPEDFNLLAAYASALGLLSVAACLRFNLAIPLPREDTTALHLLLLSLASGGLIALLVALPIVVVPSLTAELIGQPDLRPYLWLLPLGVFLAAAYDALQYWASRQRRFGLIARTRVIRAIGGTSAQAGVGTLTPGPFGLLLGHMLLSGLGFLALAWSFWRHDRQVAAGTRSSDLALAARRYRQFPIYSVPEALFNTAGLEISILIIAAIATGPEAGFLMLAMRVLGVPMMLVGSSVAQVYLTEGPQKLRQGELADFTRRTMWTMTKLGAPLLLAVAIVSPFLFPIVFGEEWSPAGMMVAWLAPMFLLQFIASPLISVLHITGQFRLAMWVQAVGAAFRIGCLLLTMVFLPRSLPEAFAVAGAMFYIATIIVVYRATPRHMPD
jgi:O-antigen/teichoic acid export membrane protein